MRKQHQRIKNGEENMKMLDYHMHFAQLVTEDHLRAADRRRGQGRPHDGQPRVIRLPKGRGDAREQGRR